MVPFKLSTLNKLWGIVRVLRGKMTLIHELFLVSSLKPVFTPTFYVKIFNLINLKLNYNLIDLSHATP